VLAAEKAGPAPGVEGFGDEVGGQEDADDSGDGEDGGVERCHCYIYVTQRLRICNRKGGKKPERGPGIGSHDGGRVAVQGCGCFAGVRAGKRAFCMGGAGRPAGYAGGPRGWHASCGGEAHE